MSFNVIIGFLKAVVPTKKVGGWILAVIGAALAMFLGVNNADLKAAYCAADAVSLPAVEAPATPAAEAVKK